MKRVALLAACLCGAWVGNAARITDAGRVARLRTDLRITERPATLQLVESTDWVVELEVRQSGMPFDASDWSAVLFYGPADSESGLAFTNTWAGRGLVQWQIPAAGLATNGTFRYQVLAQQSGASRAEEWMRGTLALDSNPAADYIPFEWGVLPWATLAQAQATAGASSEVARAAAVLAAAESAAELYQPAGDYLTEIPAEVISGAAAGITAVQPADLSTARVAYATSAGTAGVATNATYVLGPEAWITMSGTTGLLYKVTDDTNTIRVVSHSQDYNGPAGPWEWWDAPEESEFTSGWGAMDGTADSYIRYAGGGDFFWYLQDVLSFDAKWVNYVEPGIALPCTLHGYSGLGEEGTVTIDWGLATNAYAIATAADLDAALAAYATNGHGHVIADVTGLQDALDSIPDEAEIESIAEAAAETVAQTAPEWIALTNMSASITLTNQYERPISLYSTGSVSVAFSGLRPPQALYCVIRGPDSLTFPGAHLVGGGSWQTNQANHFLVWSLGTNLMVHPVTTTPLED